MSSIYRDDRSPYWTACFTAYVGQQAKQLKKSTATADKELAKLVALKLEEAGRGGLSADEVKRILEAIGDLRARRAAHRAFDDVLRLVVGAGLENRTTRSLVESWLERTKGEVAPATLQRYEAVASRFLESLAGKAEQDSDSLTETEILRFRDGEAARVSVATVNLSLKILRVMFADARAVSEVIKRVKPLKKRGKATVRRAFTLEELKQILAACDDEWRSLVLFGFYSGGRLGDLATLTWENIDLAGGELRYESGKTGRAVKVPLAKPLREHLEQMPAGDNPKQPLHPRAYEVATRQGRVGSLSNDFHEILVSAGLAKARSHKRDESAKSKRDGKRKASEVSFHALRHTAVSLLKMAGVGEAVAMDLVGHDSADISRHYTHVDHATKLDAVNRLPVL
ncbi:MAG: site-specific integrase [Hyphomicrobiaceae bacterium]|nr:MAG: site-specific integrase [Hyphomicrobiaceae bacterium]